jgi:hypothetical protein
MLARLKDRLKQLEDKIAPKGRHLVFVHFEEPDAPRREEQLARQSTASRPATSSTR